MAPRWCWLLFLALVLERAAAASVTLTASTTTATAGQTITLTAAVQDDAGFFGAVNCTFFKGDNDTIDSNPEKVPKCLDLPVKMAAGNITTCDTTQDQAGTIIYKARCFDAKGRLDYASAQAAQPMAFAISNLVTVLWAGNSASKILLSPDFEEAHCGEEVRLVATAVDDSNNPVANTTLCFFISGQPQLQHYHPELKRICHVTDALGSVALTFTSKLPGPVAVVAASRNSAGIPVVSRASHAMFWGHDEHEEHQHHGGSKGWWRNTEYSAAAIKQAIDGMAAASVTEAPLP